MGLVDKIQATGDSDRLHGHQLKDVMVLVLTGALTAAQGETALEASANVTLDATDKTQLGEIKTHYDGLNAVGKSEFLHKLDPALSLLKSGLITGAQWKTLMGVN